MPFPPLTKDAVFDYESVLNEHVCLLLSLAIIVDMMPNLSTACTRDPTVNNQKYNRPPKARNRAGRSHSVQRNEIRRRNGEERKKGGG